MDSLEGLGVQTDGRLFVSDRAQLILPIHLELDSCREEALGDSHPDVLATLGHLADLYATMGRPDRSAVYQKRIEDAR